MRNGVIASLLAVAILAGAGVGYLIGNGNERTMTSTSTEPENQACAEYRPHRPAVNKLGINMMLV